MNLAAPSILQSMLLQITIAPPDCGSERQQERMEAELIALLDRNRSTKDLHETIGVERTTIAVDMARLEKLGYVAVWTVDRSKWFGLTPKGVARAKILREMQ